ECHPARAGLKRLRYTSVSTPSGCVRRGHGGTAQRPPRELIPSQGPSTSPKTILLSHRSSTNGYWRVICYAPGIQHTQRRCAAISCGAPIQKESRSLPLITAILSGCFRASACAARRTELVCARVGGKEL